MELGPPDDWQRHGPDTSNPYGNQGFFDAAMTHFDAMAAPFFLPTHTATDGTYGSTKDAATLDQWRRPETLPGNPDGAYDGFPDGNAYVKQAPTLQEVLNGPEERDAPITYWHSTTASRQFRYIPIPDDAEQRTTTEGEAAQELDTFLREAPGILATIDHPDAPGYARYAERMRRNLRLICSHEFHEATASFAGLWKTYLADNPTHQIFVPVGAIRVSDAVPKKSDARVFEATFSHLDPSEQERIVTRPKDIHSLQRTKVVLFDDRSKSSVQMANGHHKTMAALQKRYSLSWRRFAGRALFADKPEVNMIIASDKQLEKFALNGETLPLHAYYHGGEDTGRPAGVASDSLGNYGGPWTTSSDSSTDIGFEDPISTMVELINDHSRLDPIPMPALVNLIRR